MKKNSNNIKSPTFVDLPDVILSFLELTDDIVFQLDLSGNIKSINRNGALVLNYEPVELIAIFFLISLNSSFRTAALNAFQGAINENKTKAFKAAVLGKYKNEFNFKFKIKSVTTQDGVRGLTGIGKNILL